MYLNELQRYMKELVDEYGPLLKRQLLVMLNSKFRYQLKNVDGFSAQMCQFGDYATGWIGDEEYLGHKDAEPNINLIRSIDVMNTFLPNVRMHRRSKTPVSIRFCAGMGEHEKDISIIPVKPGEEQTVSLFVNDKVGEGKCEIVIFLLEDKKQIKALDVDCNAKYALINKKGVSLYTLK